VLQAQVWTSQGLGSRKQTPEIEHPLSSDQTPLSRHAE
jgi:hypothetical protein